MLPFKGSRRRSAVAVVFVVLVAGFLATTSHGQALGSAWTGTTSLPTTLGLESCATSDDYGYVFCVGGLTSPSVSYTNQAEIGILTAGGGVTSWNSTTPYPATTGGESCVTYAVSIICVGGYHDNGDIVTAANSVYSAPILVSGLGAWTAETSYPFGITLESCVTGGAYLDCIGGYTGSQDNSSVYYSQMTRSGGVGTWAKTASYPIGVNSPSCVSESGYVYCVGGATGSSGHSDVYFAPLLSSGGVGAWAQTTSYPVPVYSHSCAATSNYIYCVGGYSNKQYSSATYYAPLSASGVGTWTQASNYPNTVDLLSCGAFSSYLYCFGGYDPPGMSNSVYYNTIPPFLLATTTSTTTSTVTTPTTKTVTTTSSITATVTSSVTETSTSISLFTLTRTSTVTSTTQSVSTTTTTHSTTLISSTTVTETTQAQAPVTTVAYLIEAAPAVVGLAAGILLTLLFSRLRRGGKSPASTGG